MYVPKSCEYTGGLGYAKDMGGGFFWRLFGAIPVVGAVAMGRCGAKTVILFCLKNPARLVSLTALARADSCGVQMMGSSL